jgi:hypothetical protein
MYQLFSSDINEKFFPDIFSKKYSNIKFSENQSGGSGVVPCGQRDRRDETNICFSPFANVFKKCTK